jgi:hypothetical protein
MIERGLDDINLGPSDRGLNDTLLKVELLANWLIFYYLS